MKTEIPISSDDMDLLQKRGRSMKLPSLQGVNVGDKVVAICGNESCEAEVARFGRRAFGLRKEG